MIDFGFGVKLDSLKNAWTAFGWRNDPKIWRWTRQNDLITVEDHEKWLAGLVNDKTVKMYMVIHEDREVGVCGLTSINRQNHNAEFSIYIAPEAQGKGLSKPTLLTLFNHGFKNMGLKTIWGETFDGNPALKIFQDIGMSVDGKRRQFYWKDGKFHDAHLISFLDDEFFARHGNRSCFT